MIETRYSKPSVVMSGNAVIPRCYSKPLSPQFNYGAIGNPPTRNMFRTYQQYEEAWAKYAQPQANITENSAALSLPITNGRPQGMPSNRPSGKILSSIVRITTPKYEGSGFVTDDAHGQEVVVTAAHVGAKDELKDITITAMNGRSVHPDGGCYINEQIEVDGLSAVEKFSPLPKEQGVSSIDVAVLTIPQNLGTTALGFVSHTVDRGSWVQFNNFEIGSSIKNPASYYGLVFSSAESLPEVISGVSYSSNYSVNRGAPGMSGGLVSVGDKVAAESFAGNDLPGWFLSPQEVSAEGVNFPGALYGFNTNFTPVNSIIVKSPTIEIALDSEKA